jgi:hypothetical protein
MAPFALSALEKQGGKFQLRAKKGQGTNFTIDLYGI